MIELAINIIGGWLLFAIALACLFGPHALTGYLWYRLLHRSERPPPGLSISLQVAGMVAFFAILQSFGALPYVP